MKKDLRPEHEQLLIRIGKKVRDLRTADNLSYMSMAEQIGISRNTYNMLELGKLSFQFTTLLLVLEHHKISLTDFFKEIENL
jgi:transcriptional regulator with XRE-family HTH domain